MVKNTRSTVLVAGLIFAAALVLGPISLLLIGAGVGEGFVVGLLMAVIPVPFYVAFALWVDRFEPEPSWLLVLAFCWGAAIAVFFSMLFNVGHQILLTSIAGEASASLLTGVIVAPVFEELSKGAALILLFVWKRGQFDNITDGIVYASMVGLGFAMTENVQYYGQALSEQNAGLVFFARGVLGPFSHPLFTSMTGIGLGWSRETHRAWVKPFAPTLGLFAAMILHSLWNLAASQGAVFFAAYVLVMVPMFIAVIVVAILSLRREANLIRFHLGSVREAGVLSDDDIVILCSVRKRLGASSRALFGGGFTQWRARRRFHRLATELAFHAWRATRDGTPYEHAKQMQLCDAVRDARAALGLSSPPPVLPRTAAAAVQTDV